jgi:hypothetical protein
MAKRWKRRPEGSNWGEFGDDDERGRMNLLTDAVRLRALREVRTGRAFCLSHPLDRPGGNVLNASRFPPVFHPVRRGGLLYFNLPFERIDPRFTDVGSDPVLHALGRLPAQGHAVRRGRRRRRGAGLLQRLPHR